MDDPAATTDADADLRHPATPPGLDDAGRAELRGSLLDEWATLAVLGLLRPESDDRRDGDAA